MIALSTSWKSRGYSDGDALVQAVADSGFEGIELEYRIGEPVFQRMVPVLKRSGLKVVSVHNYFPIPPIIPHSKGGGDLFLLSHPDKEERLAATRWTAKTIEHAGGLGAIAVVLHCGRVEMAHEMEKLRGYFNSGRIDSEEARAFIKGKLEERDQIKPEFMDSLLFSIDRLLPIAKRHNIVLGLENRYHYYELPGPDDFETLLSEFKGGPLGYWHDTGHAHANEMLGIVSADEMLKRYDDHLTGLHLHDAIGLDDHLPPGKGEIDFDSLRHYLETDIPAVLELKPGTPDSDVAEGFSFVRQIVESVGD